MRSPIVLLVAAVLALSGCDRIVEKSVDRAVDKVTDKFAAAPGEGWSMQVLGSDVDRIYLVIGPHGQTAAARLKDGVSTLIDAKEAEGLIDTGRAALAEGPQPPQKVAISAPGLSLKVSGDDDRGDGRGSVKMNIGGVNIDVSGDEAGDGRGAVRIGGVDERAALKFIDEIDDLSPEVKKQMRDKLGL